MSEDKYKEEHRHNSSYNATTSPIQAKPSTGLVCLYSAFDLEKLSFESIIFSLETELQLKVHSGRPHQSCICR